MKHECHTGQQGRLPCTCNLHDDSPYGSPWAWIDDLSYPLDRALLIACAALIVAIPYLLFH